MALEIAIPDVAGLTMQAAPGWASNRRRVMFVAKQRFARFGFQSASLGELARLAELPESEVLKHFRTPLDLLLAIFEEGWALINPRAAEIAMTAADAREATAGIITVVLHMLDKDPDLTRLMLVEGRRVDPATGRVRVSHGYLRFLQTCEDLVVRGQRDGTFKVALQPKLIADLLIGSVEGLLRGRLLAVQQGDACAYSTQGILAAFDVLMTQLKPLS